MQLQHDCNISEKVFNMFSVLADTHWEQHLSGAKFLFDFLSFVQMFLTHIPKLLYKIHIHQSGFRANCSTDTGLSRLKDMTLNETENLKHTCMI